MKYSCHCSLLSKRGKGVGSSEFTDLSFGISRLHNVCAHDIHEDLCLHWLYSLKQDLLEDPSIIRAIDEETEFNALVVYVTALCPNFYCIGGYLQLNDCFGLFYHMCRRKRRLFLNH